MKNARILLVTISALLFSLSGYSQDHDFRNVDWGMTKDHVRKAESASLCKAPEDDYKQDCICYDETLGGLPYQLYYCFKDNKLESAFYQRNDASSNPSSQTDLFYTLKLVLERKYGNDYYMVLKEGAGWGDYTMLVDSKKDLENLLRQDEFMVSLIWKKDDRTQVILELQNMKTSQVRNGRIAIIYEPVSRSVIYDDKSFGKEDYQKL